MIVQTHKVNCPNAKMDITHHYNTKTSWDLVDIMVAMNEPHDVSGVINTPKGSLTLKTKWNKLDISDSVPWFYEDGYMIKSIDDYEKVKALIDDTEYIPNYASLKEFQTILGDYGIVPAFLPKTPFQAIILMMGVYRLSIEYYTHRKELDDLYHIIYKKELEIYKIAAESPAEVIWPIDNVTSAVTTPRFFEKYNLPFYNEVAGILHKQNKILMVHMDGLLKDLSDLIEKTQIDVIESFTPPPIGDFAISEARKKWKNKVIWSNFPESVSLEGQSAVRKKTIEMLKDAAPGNGFLIGISEDFPSDTHLLTTIPTILSTVAKYGTYPIRIN
jgi:hypothetical protein